MFTSSFDEKRHYNQANHSMCTGGCWKPTFTRCSVFAIYSFLGWCMEVVFCTVRHRKASSTAAFLNGPVCPIYGFGMVSCTRGARPLFRQYRASAFFGGMALTSALESGRAAGRSNVFFHTTWWDYSDKPMNLGGYIRLQFSLRVGAVRRFGGPFSAPGGRGARAVASVSARHGADLHSHGVFCHGCGRHGADHLPQPQPCRAERHGSEAAPRQRRALRRARPAGPARGRRPARQRETLYEGAGYARGARGKGGTARTLLEKQAAYHAALEEKRVQMQGRRSACAPSGFPAARAQRRMQRRLLRRLRARATTARRCAVRVAWRKAER